MMISKGTMRGAFSLFSVLCFIGISFLSSSSALASDMIDMPVVKLRSLDKVTARTKVFEANVGSTVKFGSLYIKVQACRKAPPIEQPESAAFLQVWQLDKQEEPVWVFSGWMFSSSPGLSSMDHPIYDVWVLDCLDNAKAADKAVAVLDDEGASISDPTQRGLGADAIETEALPATE